jgi:hypothetical protein
MTGIFVAVAAFVVTYGFLWACDLLGGWLLQRFPSLACAHRVPRVDHGSRPSREAGSYGLISDHQDVCGVRTRDGGRT